MSKLVRDKIIDIMKSEGKNPDFEILDEANYLTALKQKLVEESNEVLNAPDEISLLEELADLQEVLDHLLRTAKVSKTQLKMAQIRKNDSKGSFKKRIFLK